LTFSFLHNKQSKPSVSATDLPVDHDSSGIAVAWRKIVVWSNRED